VTWEQDVLGQDHPVLIRNPCKRRVRQSYEFPNGSEFVIAGLDDPGKTLSSQYDFIYIQEATEEGVDDNTYQTLTRCLRNGKTPFTQVMSDCNPTSPIHFLYKRQGPGKKLRMYTSTHKDNPAYWDRTANDWTTLGRSYIEGTLKAMTGARRARFYEGKWQAAEGLVFDGFINRPFDANDNPGHILPAGWKPPSDWPRVWSIDWGFTSPLVLQLWAVDGDGRMYLYREYYHTGIRAEAVGEWAKQQLDLGNEPRPRAVVCDHDPLMKAEFEKGSGLVLQLADKKDLMAGIQVVQGRFDKAGDGRPRIFVSESAVVKVDTGLEDAGRPTCFIEELCSYIWDTNSVIERPLDKDNHASDACRYAVRWVDANLVNRVTSLPRPAKPLLPPSLGVPRGPKRWG
jgi:phage terminase large subunit